VSSLDADDLEGVWRPWYRFPVVWCARWQWLTLRACYVALNPWKDIRHAWWESGYLVSSHAEVDPRHER